jgi:AcrR family transcriptional regulator
MSATREAVLDAAYDCFVEVGPTRTLHRSIAQRAGVSRPTVYKHVGDREAIAFALLERELARFYRELRRTLDEAATVRDRFVGGLVFTVTYAQQHPVLTRVLEEEPELVVPWLTTRAAPIISEAVDFTRPYLVEAIERGELRALDPDVIAEWMVRLAFSLILTPGVTLQLDDEGRLRRFIDTLFTVGLLTEGDAEPR